MRKLLTVFGAAIVLGAAGNASAACTGTIQGVSLEASSGDIMLERINLTDGRVVWWARLCSVVYTANGVPPEGCKPVYAALLAAQAQSRSITYYSRSGACAPPAAWQFIDQFYFLTVN